jgi:hypothetical protein
LADDVQSKQDSKPGSHVKCLSASQIGLGVLRFNVSHVHAGRHAHGMNALLVKRGDGLGCIKRVASGW